MRLHAATMQILALTVLASAVGAALGQSDEPARPSYSRMLNIDSLIDNHVRFLARRYNLSEDQEAYTLAFVRQKADSFLQKHREELYDLVDRLFEVRAGGDMDSQDLVKWGQRALPLYEEAKLLIIDGNSEWRGVLTDEQRKTHDEDLREMNESFTTTEDQLRRIVSGQMTLDEFRKGPGRQAPRLTANQGVKSPPTRETPPVVARETPPVARETPAVTREATPHPAPVATATPTTPTNNVRPTPDASGRATSKPALRPADSPAGSTRRGQSGRDRAGQRGQPSPGAGSADFESQWEAYVRDFIQRYQLDESQTQKAQSILKDCQELAQRQMQKRKPEIERLDKKLATLPESKDKPKEVAEINQQRTKLLEPITEIFEKQLKPRLERLPTRAQRQAAEQAGRPNPTATGKGGRKTPPTPTPAQPQPQPPPRPVPQPEPQPEPQPVPPPPPQPEPAPQPDTPEAPVPE